VWDAVKGQEIFSLRGHTDIVSSVAYSPDGSRIVSGSDDQTVRVWDAVKGQEIFSLKGHTLPVTSVAYSPDGSRIVSGGGEFGKPGEVRVWDAVKGQEIFPLRGHTDDVSSVAYSPDGSRIVSGSRDSTVRVWDAVKCQEIFQLKGHTSDVTSVAFSPDGKQVLGRDITGKILAWDVVSGQLLPDAPRSLPANATPQATSPNGKLRAIAGGLTVRVERIPDFVEAMKRQQQEDRDLLQRWARFDPDHHRQQAQAAENNEQYFAAAFHLRRLLAHDRDNAELKRRLAVNEAKHRTQLQAALEKQPPRMPHAD
jgi:hypothetical protein